MKRIREASRVETELRVELAVIRKIERALALLPNRGAREDALMRLWKEVRATEPLAQGDLFPPTNGAGQE